MNLQKLDYERHILPLLAIAETIATQGKSPGTSAMNQQAIIRGNRDAEAARQRQYLEDEREAKRQAMQESLYGFQIEEGESKREERKQAQDIKKKLIEKLTGKEDVSEIDLSTIESSADPAKTYSDLMGKKEEAGRKAKEKSFDQETRLSTAYLGQSKDFFQVRDSYSRIQASGKDPSAAGDLALIFNYMKMLDPGSTVREGEFANAENSAGISERVRKMYNKTMSGERLTTEMRKDFLTRSKSLYQAQRQSQKAINEYYTQKARRYEIDPDNIVMPLDIAFESEKHVTPSTDPNKELKARAASGDAEAQEFLSSIGEKW